MTPPPSWLLRVRDAAVCLGTVTVAVWVIVRVVALWAAGCQVAAAGITLGAVGGGAGLVWGIWAGRKDTPGRGAREETGGMSTDAREAVLDHVFKLFSDDLNLCGCGSPEAACDLVRDLLALAPEYGASDEVRRLLTSEAVYHLVLGQLDGAELIEHGTSLNYAWLTPKGIWYLAALRSVHDWSELEDQEQFSIGFPHDGGACTDDCWKLPIGSKAREEVMGT